MILKEMHVSEKKDNISISLFLVISFDPYNSKRTEQISFSLQI